MKFNPKYIYFLLIPVALILLSVLVFQLVNIPLGIFRSLYSTNAPGNNDQITRTVTVADYDEISITGSMDVELVPGPEGQITVTAPSNISQYIKIESQNKALQIYSDQWKNIGFNVQFGNNNRTLVRVPVQTLSRITLTGSGKLDLQNSIVSDKLIVNLLGSGNMNLNVNAGELESNTSGSGNIAIQGKSNNYLAQVFGSGSIDASQMEAQSVNAKITGSGDIRLWAIQSMKAETFGSGNILYKGNPTVNDIRVSGSGEINKIE